MRTRDKVIQMRAEGMAQQVIADILKLSLAAIKSHCRKHNAKEVLKPIKPKKVKMNAQPETIAIDQWYKLPSGKFGRVMAVDYKDDSITMAINTAIQSAILLLDKSDRQEFTVSFVKMKCKLWDVINNREAT